MEGTSSYGAGLTRHLASLGMPVREALSPARMQRRRPGQGKCDEWIGNTYLDDSGRDSPASLNSTGDM